MKKILFAAAAMAAALFASCDKADETTDPVIPEAANGARIAITLTGADDADTRAFFDSSAKAETWESSLSTLSVFAFDDADNLIIAGTSPRRSSRPSPRPSRFRNPPPAPSARSTP